MNVLSHFYKRSFAIWKLIPWATVSVTSQYHNRILPSTGKQKTKNTTKIYPRRGPRGGGPYLTVQFKKIHDWHMKNTINISRNVNLILNTYRCIFFETATENLRCCSTASTMPCKTFQQDKTAWKWEGSVICKFVNHNSAKMIDKHMWHSSVLCLFFL